MGKRCAGTQLADTSFGNQFGEAPKIKYTDVNRVAFAARRIFDEITPASGTVVLNERLAGLDLYLPAFAIRPIVAVPCIANHET